MRVPFLEGNDRIAKILIAPLLVGLLIFVVNVLVNAWHEGPEALIGLAAIPFFPVFMMPAQAILFLMGRSQHIRTTPRVMLVLLSYVLLIGLIIWGWANNDAMAQSSTGGVGLMFVAFAHAGIAAAAGLAARKFGISDDAV